MRWEATVLILWFTAINILDYGRNGASGTGSKVGVALGFATVTFLGYRAWRLG